MRGTVLAVVGAQYGSEGKGVVVNHLARRFDAHVRVGGPNAGHSFVHMGNVYKMQVIPCGWTNPNARLFLGRGMLVDPTQLMKELAIISQVDSTIVDRLHIDARAGVLDHRHHQQEGGTAGEMHRRIGSTGEGVGAARVARVNRDPANFSLFQDVAGDYGGPNFTLADMMVDNVSKLLNDGIDWGMNVLLEGTQGCHLSLIHGPWPYVTSADTNAAQLASDVGLAPGLVDRVLLVARTYPIRVAGNSGPLKSEITWGELSDRLGKTIEEKTTVTRKVRRVGEWDNDLIKVAAQLNRPTSVAMMFADYISPEDEGKTDYESLSLFTKSFAAHLGATANAPVVLIGTGGEGWQIAERTGYVL